MAGGVNSPEPDNAGVTDETLWRLYSHAVDEYRFQVNLNWQRLQYFLGLNLAILGVGSGLLRLGSGQQPHPSNTLPGLVFVAGVLLSLASWYLARKQQGYYRNARDKMTEIAGLLDIAHLGVATTAGARRAATGRFSRSPADSELAGEGHSGDLTRSAWHP